MDSNAVIDFFNGSLPINGKRLLSSIQPAISVATQNATALVYKLTLITRNGHDFKNIDGLKTLNPYEV